MVDKLINVANAYDDTIGEWEHERDFNDSKNKCESHVHVSKHQPWLLFLPVIIVISLINGVLESLCSILQPFPFSESYFESLTICTNLYREREREKEQSLSLSLLPCTSIFLISHDWGWSNEMR